ncbi:MAG TPA: ribosomal protein S18-alanine N-acetyltransferase [Acidobacteriaceae bacterium]|nr:ribosomal protein S18-alanine N-acetyltransferase [Acidobacteriaceae bacterium]
MFSVRPLAPLDIDAILEINASTPEAARWPREAYESYLGGKGVDLARRIFVAEKHEKLVGYIAGRVAVDICELEAIAVPEAMRRGGVGKALLSALIDWARSRSALQVQLEVRSGNNSAISFYCNAGFHRDGVRAGYYQRPDEDAVLMSLPLERVQQR